MASDLNAIEKTIRVMSIFRGSPQGDKPLKELKKDFERHQHKIINPQGKLYKKIRFKGRVFEFILDPRDVNAGQFIDVSNLTKKPEDYIDNYNKILALLMREKTRFRHRLNFEEKAELVLDMPIEKVNPVHVFFSTLSTELLKSISESLQEEAQKIKESI